MPDPIKERIGIGYEFRNAASDDFDAELLIYDMIGEDMLGEGVTAKQFAQDLKDLGDIDSLNVRINSAGGSVFDASAIYNQIAQHSAAVTVDIDGMALSAASHIAMAGDTIRMAENALMMIHDPIGVVMGPSKDMRDTADLLDKIRDTIATAYVARTGQTRKTIHQMMADETWMDASEAKDEGFIDEVTASKRATASVDPTNLYQVPDRFRDQFRNCQPGRSGSASKKGNDMADTKQPVMSAAEFAEQNPDAAKSVEQLRAEGAEEVKQQVQDEAKQSGSQETRERIKQFADQVDGDWALAAEHVYKNATEADLLKAYNAKLKKERDDASKRAASLEDGAEPVATDSGAAINDGDSGADTSKYEGMDIDARIEEEWEDGHENCQKRFKNFNAYRHFRHNQLRREARAV